MGIHGNAGEYRGMRGKPRNTGEYMGILGNRQGNTGGYKLMHTNTGEYMGINIGECMGIQGSTREYNEIQGNAGNT